MEAHKSKAMKLIAKDLTEKVIGVCIEVSRELGGAFLESVYQKALLRSAASQLFESHRH